MVRLIVPECLTTHNKGSLSPCILWRHNPLWVAIGIEGSSPFNRHRHKYIFNNNLSSPKDRSRFTGYIKILVLSTLIRHHRGRRVPENKRKGAELSSSTLQKRRVSLSTEAGLIHSTKGFRFTRFMSAECAR